MGFGKKDHSYISMKTDVCTLYRIHCSEIHRILSLPKQGGIRILSYMPSLLVYSAQVRMLGTPNQASDHHEHSEFCHTCGPLHFVIF